MAALQPVVAGKLYQQGQGAVQPGHALKSVLQQSPAAARSEAAAAAAQAGAEGLLSKGGAAGSFSASLSPVASSSLLPTVQSSASAGSLAMGQPPITVDLGGSDQLVIALVHKEAVGGAAAVPSPSAATA